MGDRHDEYLRRKKKSLSPAQGIGGRARKGERKKNFGGSETPRAVRHEGRTWLRRRKKKPRLQREISRAQHSTGRVRQEVCNSNKKRRQKSRALDLLKKKKGDRKQAVSTENKRLGERAWAR